MNILILTSAIRTVKQAFQRKDEKIRLHDCFCSIYSWLQVPQIDHIIFVDGSDVTIPNKVFNSDKLEIITCNFQNIPNVHDHGRAELDSMRYALQTTRMWNQCNEFYKCTGRLFVKNHEEFIPNTTEYTELVMFDHSKSWGGYSVL